MAFDFSSQASSTGSVNSLTWSHTVSGYNPVLFVIAGENSGAPSVTGVTYAGVAMTNSGLTFAQSGAPIYYLFNPPTGTANIVITRSTTATSVIRGVGASYTAHGGLALDNTSHGVSGPAVSQFAQSLTTIASNCWVFAFASNDSSATVTSNDSVFTLRKANTGDPSFAIFDTNGAVVSPSSKTATLNTSGPATIGIAMASIPILYKFSVSDTQGTTDTASDSFSFSTSDTQGSSDSSKTSIGPSNQQKNNSNWINLPKS